MLNKYQSLSARIVLVVILMAIVTYAIFVGLTLRQLNVSLDQQAKEISKISDERLANTLDRNANLAHARMEVLFEAASESDSKLSC